jgi:CheY-like chemotaxis protein
MSQIAIFLVDDDEDDIYIFKDIVYNKIDLPINVITSSNGFECLKLLENMIPDIIFLDINMPVMGGIECLELIKSNSEYKHIPVVMYSTTTNKKEIEIIEKLGAHFLSKPVSFHNSAPPLHSIILKVIASDV